MLVPAPRTGPCTGLRSASLAARAVHDELGERPIGKVEDAPAAHAEQALESTLLDVGQIRHPLALRRGRARVPRSSADA
jgi:hypothetical protein